MLLVDRYRLTLNATLALGLSFLATPSLAQEIAAPSVQAAPSVTTAQSFLAAVQPSPTLQRVLNEAVTSIGRTDTKWLRSQPRIAVLDLSDPKNPKLAEVRGRESVYPASVVKFVYLMAAYAWQEQGRLRIDDSLDLQLKEMIRESSNQATRQVFARLTQTEPGPELPTKEYAEFRERRMSVKRWLESLGVQGLHAVNPTYDGGGDLFGRDQQFLRDASVQGGLASTQGGYSNRQAMTAVATVELLALLATNHALTPEDSTAVRVRMKRSLAEQPHLVHRITGGAASFAGSQVSAKSGTWGPIYADAGLVRSASGAEFAIAVFTDSTPPYRGEAIAELTRLIAAHLFASAPNVGRKEDP